MTLPAHVQQVLDTFLVEWRKRGWTEQSWYLVRDRLGFEPYPGDITIAYQVGAPLCGYWYNWWIRVPEQPPVPDSLWRWIKSFPASYPVCQAALEAAAQEELGQMQIEQDAPAETVRRRGRYVPRVPARAVSHALEVLFR